MKNLGIILGVMLLFGCTAERSEREEEMDNTVAIESVVYETKTHERVEVIEVEGTTLALWHNSYGSDMEVLERADEPEVVVTDGIPHTKFYEHSCGEDDNIQPTSVPVEPDLIENERPMTHQTEVVKKTRFKSDIFVNELPGDSETVGGRNDVDYENR